MDSEYELMQRLSAGNEDAFGELFGRYYPRVCAFVGCIVKEESTAEDIAQDIFLKIWERRDIFRGRVASFNGYVYRMARNAALNAIRQMTNIDWEQYIQIEETLPDESFEREYYSREKELFIRLVVCRMPEQRRRIFEMSRYAGWTISHCRRTQDIETNGRKPPDARIEKLREALAVFSLPFFMH
ncbi:MAG: sigma-70 family RNA polymerase sigma factor [Alistipes onderdonkii]